MRRFLFWNIFVVFCAVFFAGGAWGTEWYFAANGVEGAIDEALDDSEVGITLEVGDGANFPTTYPYLVWVGTTECVEVTDVTGDVLTVVRGADGTTAVSHLDGEAVGLYVSAGYVVELQEAVTRANKLLALAWGGGTGVVRDAQVATYLKVVATGPVGMSVSVGAGLGLFVDDVEEVGVATVVGPIVAPVANPRIDIVQLTLNEGLNIKTGVEAGSPEAPSPDADSTVLAEIYCRVGMVSIKNTDDSSNGYITDRRVYL